MTVVVAITPIPGENIDLLDVVSSTATSATATSWRSCPPFGSRVTV